MRQTTIITSTLLCLGLASSPNLLAEISINPPVTPQVQPANPSTAPNATAPNEATTEPTAPPVATSLATDILPEITAADGSDPNFLCFLF